MFNKNDPTVIRCGEGQAIAVSMKDKTIKLFNFKVLYRTFPIEEETEVHIKGLNELKTKYIFISRYEYKGIIRILTGCVKGDKLDKGSTSSCRIGVKKF